MTLQPNTLYVYTFKKDLFLVKHTENNQMQDIIKLTDTDSSTYIVNWDYNPQSESHKTFIFTPVDEYKNQYPEYFV